MKTKQVLAILLLSVLVVASVSGQGFPKPRGYVSDFADIIDSGDESRMAQFAASIRKATSIEIAVVTVKTFSPYGSIEQYSIDLATEWGIGKAGDDSGMLLLVALQEREARIEVGYGLEGVFPDGLVGRIMDKSMIPYFKNNDFGTGLAKAMEGIAGVIQEEYDVDLAGVSLAESQKYAGSSGRSSANLYPIVSFIVLFLLGGGRFFWPILFLGGMGRHRSRGGFGVSSRGGFGSSGGGGFSGFSGGSFGGGGSSRGF
jgi:uncharacterized protein